METLQKKLLAHHPFELNLKFIKFMVILGVLVISATVVAWSKYIPWKYAVGILILAIFGLVAIRNTKLILTLLILTSATTGLTIDTGTSTTLPLAMLAITGSTAIWVVKMAVIERQVQVRPSPLNLPLSLFLIAALIAWISGNGTWNWRIPDAKSNLVIVQAGQYALFALSFAAAFPHRPPDR